MIELIIEFIGRIIDKLTVSKIIQLMILVIATMIVIIIIENQESFFKLPNIAAPKPLNVVGGSFSISKSTQKRVQQLVASDPSILGIAIRNADIRLNKNVGVYFYGVPGTHLDEVYSSMRSNGTDILPLWSVNQDLNNQIIRLINGEFYCVPFNNTLLYSLRPDLGQEVKMVCRASLPPYYGYFSGFITVYINRELNINEILYLQTLTKDLSTLVYREDVVPTFEKVE